jgi:hypothetical protein
MRLNKSMMLGAVLVLAACGGKQVDDTEYVEATPDLSGVALEINESVADEGAKLNAADFGVYEAALQGEGPEYLEGARMQVKALNTALRQAITRVVELTNGELVKALSGDVVEYGPKDGAEATWRLRVKKLGEASFAWKLEARPLGSSDEVAYKLVAAGQLVRGVEAHRGKGNIGINFDNLKAVVPSSTGQGKLMASFAHPDTGGKALAYRLAEFTLDPATQEPVTGAFVGHKLATGATSIRLFGQWNLAQTATDAKETVFTTVRFRPGVGGRADIRATGGDIPADTAYIGSACWDAQEHEVFKVLRKCVKGDTRDTLSCEELARVGERTACPADDFKGDVAPPPEDKTRTTQEPGSPKDPDAVPSDVTAKF